MIGIRIFVGAFVLVIGAGALAVAAFTGVALLISAWVGVQALRDRAKPPSPPTFALMALFLVLAYVVGWVVMRP